MTAREASDLVVQLTIDLSDARALLEAAISDRNSYRFVAVAAIHHGHVRMQEIQKLRARQLELIADLRAARGIDTESYFRDRQAVESDLGVAA